MNISELKKIIHDVVVKAMREEFREILTEAVTTVKEEKTGSREYGIESVPDFVQEEVLGKPRSISSLLQETAAGMSREDYRAFVNTGTAEQKTQPVMQEMPSFMAKAIANAKEVFDASNRKNR